MSYVIEEIISSLTQSLDYTIMGGVRENMAWGEQAADGIRSRDLVLTKHALYQAELRRR